MRQNPGRQRQSGRHRQRRVATHDRRGFHRNASRAGNRRRDVANAAVAGRRTKRPALTPTADRRQCRYLAQRRNGKRTDHRHCRHRIITPALAFVPANAPSDPGCRRPGPSPLGCAAASEYRRHAMAVGNTEKFCDRTCRVA
ncbi:hypothetical protein SDC9_184947 [bioreactor metagenome]|uniref:Uncharacterized protein n=1 Tax=bioreactor metagenome TaxID=1076179 RepID=A0A645HGW8_9ZZZZ